MHVTIIVLIITWLQVNTATIVRLLLAVFKQAQATYSYPGMSKVSLEFTRAPYQHNVQDTVCAGHLLMCVLCHQSRWKQCVIHMS